LENGPVVTYTLDSKLQTLYISPYCQHIFGCSHQEIINDFSFWDHHIHPEDRGRVCRRRQRHLEEGGPFTLEYRAIHRDSTTRHIINHCLPVSDNGSLQYIDGFVYDITARKHLEEQLALAEKIKLLNELSLSVAHEIRNPLTSIGGFARLLYRRMTADDKNRHHLEIILKEVARLEDTVNRVLDNLKQIRLRPVMSDINEVVTTVLDCFQQELQHRGISMRLRLSREVPLLRIDPHLMEQALSSVIHRMLRTTQSSGDLCIATFKDKLEAVIEIQSSGWNSAPATESQLFFPFYREATFANDSVALSLAQQIIAEHGGHMVLRNGSTSPPVLVVTLPIPDSTH